MQPEINEWEIGSEEWINKRLTCITATDASAIMGMSPYETALQRYEAKRTGARKEITPAMQRGIDLEPMARLIYQEQTGNIVYPSWRVHREMEWMAATFDGINDEGKAVEIKCPGEADHLVAVGGKIPEKYFCQLQHQMAVEELEQMDYFSYRPEYRIAWAIVHVQADYEFQEKMIKAEKEFLECLRNGIAPDPMPKDVILRENRSWLLLEDELFHVRHKRKQLEEQEKKIKDEMIAMCEGQASRGYRLKISPSEVIGHVQYDSIPQLKGVDLEPFRKPSSTRWTIYEI